MDRIKVLIADSSVISRQMMKNILAAAEDIEVVEETGTGPGCVILLEDANPDVVLVEADITGGMSITDIVKEVKGYNKNTQVVLCFNITSREKVEAAANSGIADFITKPYNKAMVLRVIRDVMKLSD